MAWLPNAIKELRNLNFFIQVSNPCFYCKRNTEDESLADAIESSFPLFTENMILTWNHISIPLSYKYDISYMILDIINMVKALRIEEKGKMTIHWLPDTFRCDWNLQWSDKKLNIKSHWDNTIGHLEEILNKNSELTLDISTFIKEWKGVFKTILHGLENCGYHEDLIADMKILKKEYSAIEGNGVLYQV